MSFYNLFFGRCNEQLENYLFDICELHDVPIGRYRDISIIDQNGEKVVMLLARNGGGNRECYQASLDPHNYEPNDKCDCSGCCQEKHLPRHKYYINDEDADWDCTYALTYFRIPEQHKSNVDRIFDLLHKTNTQYDEIDIEIENYYKKLNELTITNQKRQNDLTYYENDLKNIEREKISLTNSIQKEEKEILVHKFRQTNFEDEKNIQLENIKRSNRLIDDCKKKLDKLMNDDLSIKNKLTLAKNSINDNEILRKQLSDKIDQIENSKQTTIKNNFEFQLKEIINSTSI